MSTLWFSSLCLLASGLIALTLAFGAPWLSVAGSAVALVANQAQAGARARLVGEVPVDEARVLGRLGLAATALFVGATLVALWQLA